MSILNKMKTLWCRAAKDKFLFLMLCVSLALGPRASAQTQAQPAGADSPQMSASPEASEVPPAVAKELQAVKARMAQMESQLKDLAALVAPPTAAGVRSARSAPTEVTLTGTLSCGHCQGYPPLHKGYTRWTWALHSVGEGDDIVLVVGNNIYKLQGDKDQLLKYMEDKVKVTGDLEGRTLTVQTIARAVKGE
jgi:hypothetical protein